MADEGMTPQFIDPSFFDWIKKAANIWLGGIAQTMPSGSETLLKTQSSVQNRFTEQLQTNLNLLKSFSRMMTEPESASATVNSMSALPEIMMKIALSGVEAAMKTQIHLMEKANRIGKRAEAYNFDNLDQQVFKALTDIYEQELRQYLKIPPLGLTRFYQERFNDMLDKHNIFQTTLAEFLSILYLPMEQSFQVLQDKLREMAEQGNLPGNIKETYGMWLKILEGHFMNLFQSSEYLDALHRTLNHLEDFLIAKDSAMLDFLQTIPVVTQKDMDDLYKEFHLLKKRVRELEKEAGISPNKLSAVK
ncbi:MAG TPA: poly(R)-hydroxyalkanoic acid synthase subunit PhaE [Smithellaceae bacterium]|nr:poly(R)-hydroxyalkanoic acid synthase subunit PhaE [Smithellaceae bacterium]HQF85338.1 poly(R)-hydroxyalkanoic acid synthase subunit PhaE [Smithellaceae bacterium]HQG81560.1 poly(R)-hydroxyalkanoic acid synthase subunit PhaE [Smithellaceae bacterium]